MQITFLLTEKWKLIGKRITTLLRMQAEHIMLDHELVDKLSMLKK